MFRGELSLEEHVAPGALLGQAVRIQGSEDEAVEGLLGICLDWDVLTGAYSVQTTEGSIATLKKEQVRHYDPPSPEEGGFDAFWPGGIEDYAVLDNFTHLAADALSQRGYFVVQTCLTPSERHEALQAAREKTDYAELREELVEDILGQANATKALWLESDSPGREPQNALSACDRLLTEAGLLLSPLAESFLDFTAVGRSEGLVRLRFANRDEAARLAPPPLSFSDEEAGAVEGHITFVRRRKVCMMHLIDNEGGNLTFQYKDGKVVNLPLRQNRLVMFRHDLLSYEYQPLGSGLAVQSWMMAPEPSFQLSAVAGIGAEKDDAMHIIGPVRPDGPKAHITSLAVRTPGLADSAMSFWSMTAFATDTVQQWPVSRCDIDQYYDPTNPMLSYTNHGGWLHLMGVVGLDTNFFGIPEAEAAASSMNQRMTLEVGYQALFYAGWTRSSLRGKRIGVHLGDVGSDWHSYTTLFSVACYDPDGHASSIHSSVVPSRLSYIFGMTGATMTYDTACSASLVATHHSHMQMINFYEHGRPDDGSLCGGVNSIGEPGFVGNCQGNMLTHLGRCFTYDRTADGYQRGEGCNCFFMKYGQSQEDVENRLGCLAGSCANQDGRSASLTAPNGPSQQQVIKRSLRMSDIIANDVSAVECHGTGTALGDPIEVGALMAVMEEGRELPLPHTSAKTNCGHLESAAGCTGLAKCLTILLHSAATPNCHLRSLNPHLVSSGFPQLFDSELIDVGTNTGYMGVSSFGFGGTNSRADVYGRAEYGPRARPVYDCAKLDIIAAACSRCGGQMCWQCGVAIPSHSTISLHRCTLIREGSDYECCTYCYEGAYRHGEAIEDELPWDADNHVYIAGTWNAWTELDEMEPDGEGAFSCSIRLGETRVEEFQLVVNRDFGATMYPVLENGNPTMRIVGPDGQGKGKHWVIDGRVDGAPIGAVYTITFRWAAPKSIQWTREETEALADLENPLLGSDHAHRYFLVGPSARLSIKEMAPCATEPGVFRTTFSLGVSCQEEFQFLRDRDRSQVLHPSMPGAEDIETTEVEGPDADGAGKHWLVRGYKGEEITVELHVDNGHFAISMARN